MRASPSARLIVFSPLAAFAAWAFVHLARGGDRPFLLKWIDLSMALMLALVASLALKKLLLDDKDEDDPGRGDP